MITPFHITTLHFVIIILQEVQQKINKMIEEAATSESDEDDDLSDDTVEGRIQCSSDMLTLYDKCV